MQFEVPQFIDVENKIFGPLTLRQFIYLAGGGGFVVILFTIVPFFLVILIGGPVLLLAAGLAFYKVNNQPLVKIIESAFYYALRNRLYLWDKKSATPKKETETEEQHTATPYVPKLSENRLKDLAWSLDIKESIYSREEQQG